MADTTTMVVPVAGQRTVPRIRPAESGPRTFRQSGGRGRLTGHLADVTAPKPFPKSKVD